MLVYPLLREAAPWLAGDVRSFYDLVPFSFATLPLMFLVIAAEEILWRGLFFDAESDREPRARTASAVFAVIVGSCAYALGQLGPGVPVLALVALLMGALWAVEAALSKALVAPLVSHAIWTLWVFGVSPLE